MTINPNAIRILCYGDSNTWGQRPDRSGRFGVGERWTSILQQELGDDFEIIEEGLNGRTTDLDRSADKPGRNGKTYLTPCILSHNPIDMVLIMLGTNDYKIQFGPRPAENVVSALEGLVQDVRRWGWNSGDNPPKVVLINPIHINTSASTFSERYHDYYDNRSANIAVQTNALIHNLAQQQGCHFLDASQVAQPGDDGIHIDQSGHRALAMLLARHLREWR